MPVRKQASDGSRQPVLIYCDACGLEDGTVHVTVQLELVTAVSTRIKIAHMWLCVRCERKNQILMARDEMRRARLARAMTPTPAGWELEPSQRANGKRGEAQGDRVGR